MNNQLGFTGINCLILAFSLGITGCAKFAKVDPVNIAKELPERPAEMSRVSDVSGKIGRVVIRIKKPVDPEKVIKKSMLERLQQAFDRELGKIPGMIVDRSLSKLISNEIELSEIYGKDSGRQEADYVMLIALDDYVSDKMTKQKEALFSDKKYFSCEIDVNYKGWVRVLTIPSLKSIAQWELKEDKSSSIDRDTAKKCNLSYKSQLQILQTKMIDNAVCNSKTSYLNALAPTGHILSVKHEKEDVLFETSLSSEVNAIIGNRIYFYHDLSLTPYAEGQIISVTTKSAWVKLDSLEEGETVYLHDWVRPHFSGILNAVKCLL